VLYAVVEGSGTEYDYLRYLNERFGQPHRFHVRVVADTRSGLTPGQALDQAKEITAEPGDEQVWLLFDRDDNDPSELVRIFAAENREPRIKIAFSNPCFELWLYLHFREAPGPQGGRRQDIYRLLRSAHEAYRNYGTGSGEKRLNMRRLDALHGHEAQAAKRARRLVADCVSGGCGHPVAGRCSPLNQDPSTGAHLLLQHLGIVGRG
jgi:hypothetical protein